MHSNQHLKRNIITVFLLMGFSIGLTQEMVYPPPVNLITIPTAGTLVRGSFAVEMRLQKNGSLTAGLAAGLTDRFMFGISYGASQLIGDLEPTPYPRPEANLKYRLIDETTSLPGVAIGLDTQGFGQYHPGDSLKRYDVKAYGLYAAASKNWHFVLGNAGLHGGMNYNFTEMTDGDEDINLFVGADLELNPEFSILLEYNAALNDNEKPLESLALNKDGYLNAALRWTFVEHLHIELEFNNLLFNKDKVDYFNRELKITYIEYF
ncbi:MAG: hypothetical protein H8E14_15625 [Candidatus Marinimicrobia bacterium]|nr:hypothetical protein [Candidatus Neomarinimicrobiota bacterium]